MALNLFRRRNADEAVPAAPEAAIGAEDLDAPVMLPIDDKAVAKATQTLEKYKQGKAHLDAKIVTSEQYWKMRQWGGTGKYSDVEATPWLHSCIESRHADVMDSYPTCNFRPRQKDDEAEAKRLSAIVPVILDQADFDLTYSKIARYTLKNGAGVYGVFWDGKAHNGLGDVQIRQIDIINLYYEPGITDIQESANVFLVSVVDDKVLEQRYPQTKDRLGGNGIAVKKYIYDDAIDTTGKSVVVDWYYHTEYGGKKILHYCKYVNDIVLFASENDPAYADGYYAHGLYPFVGQTLYPIEGSPFGYGLVDIGRGTQNAIDLMNKAIYDNALEGSVPRYFYRGDGTINEDEFRDLTKRLVRVEGELDETHLRQIVAADLPGIYVTYMNNKIEELKYCTANQDANNGVAPSGITAASALAALQEVAGKQARSANKTFHQAYKEVILMVVELIRQFYDQPRTFRIATDAMTDEYMQYTNAGLRPQMQTLSGNNMGYRVPEFDVEVTVEKANPYKKMENNELMLQFFGLGLFNPQNADQSIMLMQNMDFVGKDKLIDQIRQQGTMYERLLQYQQIALQLAQATDPALADKLAQTIMMTDGGFGATAQKADVNLDAVESVEGAEHPAVQKSRARARASTQAD